MRHGRQCKLVTVLASSQDGSVFIHPVHPPSYLSPIAFCEGHCLKRAFSLYWHLDTHSGSRIDTAHSRESFILMQRRLDEMRWKDSENAVLEVHLRRLDDSRSVKRSTFFC